MLELKTKVGIVVMDVGPQWSHLPHVTATDSSSPPLASSFTGRTSRCDEFEEATVSEMEHWESQAVNTH